MQKKKKNKKYRLHNKNNTITMDKTKEAEEDNNGFHYSAKGRVVVLFT